MARRPRILGRLAAPAAWAGALVAVSALAPRLIEGYGALEATRFHALRASGPHAGEHARRAGHSAARTIDLVAPLPWARQAARLALDAAGGLEGRNRPSMLAAYDEVRAALERAAGSAFRGMGLRPIAQEARARDEDARAAAPRTAPP